LPKRNTHFIDACNKTFDNFATIQVKTSSNGESWRLTRKSEESYGNFFYIFLDLKNTKYYVVPGDLVANIITLDHKN
jgi:hypothetical protein